jgi:tetratricopeptide (TPR) repeat protein
MAPTLLEIDSWPPAPPDGGVPELYDQALGCIDDGDLERASQLLDELLNSNPDHLLGRITHGNVLLGLHRFDEAASRYAEAHAREPLMAEIHYFQGLVFRKTGQLEQAAAAFRRAVFLDDGFWPAAYQHASALRRLGRLERSRAELKHTLRALESGATSPFRSHVAGLFGLGAPAERVAEACRRELARDRSLWD